MSTPKLMTTQIISVSTIWYMHCVIMEMDDIVPFADTWNIRTGFTYDTTQENIATVFISKKEIKKQCLDAWREFCHQCLDDLSVT